jgi:hypothetical protein
MGCTVSGCHRKICHTSVTLGNESLIIDNASRWSTMKNTKFGLPRFFNIVCEPDTERGRSSGVEHDLAKVGVEGSNPFARSNFYQVILPEPVTGSHPGPGPGRGLMLLVLFR